MTNSRRRIIRQLNNNDNTGSMNPALVAGRMCIQSYCNFHLKIVKQECDAKFFLKMMLVTQAVTCLRYPEH